MPELWVAIADHYDIDALRRTTRDEPDYDRLMHNRIAALDRHGITVGLIRQAIAEVKPMAGARAFLEKLHALMPVAVAVRYLRTARPPVDVAIGLAHADLPFLSSLTVTVSLTTSCGLLIRKRRLWQLSKP